MKFDIIIDNLGFIMSSTGVTAKVTVLSFLGAITIALVVGTLRSYKIPKVIEIILCCYVEVFRGSPLLIQLFLIYYGLPSIGITMESLVAAVLGLSLNSGAYMSEVVRSSIMAVDKGQNEAAFTLGFSKLQSVFNIIIPQSLRIAIPNLVNAFSGLLKDSSLVSVLSINELTRSGQLIYTRTSRPFEVYITLGILYFAMTYIVSLISKLLQSKLNSAYK